MVPASSTFRTRGRTEVCGELGSPVTLSGVTFADTHTHLGTTGPPRPLIRGAQSERSEDFQRPELRAWSKRSEDFQRPELQIRGIIWRGIRQRLAGTAFEGDHPGIIAPGARATRQGGTVERDA